MSSGAIIGVISEQNDERQRGPHHRLRATVTDLPSWRGPRRKKGLSRQVKLVIHLCLLGIIAISLYAEGGKLADWLFVALGICVECL